MKKNYKKNIQIFIKSILEKRKIIFEPFETCNPTYDILGRMSSTGATLYEIKSILEESSALSNKIETQKQLESLNSSFVKNLNICFLNIPPISKL
jgi:hypothetical protein